jgi:hypothetical protein
MHKKMKPWDATRSSAIQPCAGKFFHPPAQRSDV